MTLDDLFLESASAGSTGAHGIAGHRGTLFGGGDVTDEMLKRVVPTPDKVEKMKFRKQRKVVSGVPTLDLNGENI